jgi:hypothetical protein
VEEVAGWHSEFVEWFGGMVGWCMVEGRPFKM